MAPFSQELEPPQNPGRFKLGAYTDFVYNVGAGAFARSTLLKKLNAGDRPGACKELLRWVYAGNPKRKLRGLEKRRQAEYDLCMTPVPEATWIG